MKNKIIYSLLLVCLALTACDKFEDRHADIYIPEVVPSNPVSDATPLHGNIKGTMLSGKTYTVDGDVIIQEGDTLLVESGVTVHMKNAAGFIVHGVFASIGTQEKPNYFTVDGVVKTDGFNPDPATDPAFKGLWRGIIGGVKCPLMVLKWTHVEFGGAAANTLFADQLGLTSGKNTYDAYFQNPNGSFIVEDSWFYGSVDDPIRVTGGKISILRNTFEKGGKTGGEAFSCKGGTVGDFAYNLIIGMATNGVKVSNSGGTNIQTKVNVYNNTILNCGWRRAQSGRGGSIDYEEGASGSYYNNLIVNCKYGPKVYNEPDLPNIFYGNNAFYGDDATVTNQFYPEGGLIMPKRTDLPNPSYMPLNYTAGASYNGSSVIGVNNPKFINGPVPLPQGATLTGVTSVANYNFGLLSSSPLINAGYTGFSPLAVVKIDPIYGASEITAPGKDIGAFQIDGSGNKH